MHPRPRGPTPRARPPFLLPPVFLRVAVPVAFRGLAVSRSGLYYLRHLKARGSSFPGWTAYEVDFLDFESGRVVTLLEDGGFFVGSDLAVSPDEQWILLDGLPIPVSELMLMENFR